MEVFLWVLGVHVVELAVLGFILLVRKNNILTKLIIQQQEYMNGLSILISEMDLKLKELDTKGSFESDDEIGFFFKNLKEMQNLLNEFNNMKK